uniref:LIM zinc-binding domain-containing protein n=1 Tax=Anopheles maculatus TaxID=74869 RepID=A0A182T7W3_9DIPT
MFAASAQVTAAAAATAKDIQKPDSTRIFHSIRMMTMDVTKPEPPSATAGMGGGNTGTMSLGGLIPTGSQQQQQQQSQQQQQQQQPNTLNNQSVAGGGPAGGGGGGGPPHPQQQLCAGCGKHIQDRFLLRALDLLWHEDCLKCGCCDCRLGEVGSTLYTKGNLMLCKRDYLRLFGNTGFCAACNKVIPAFEMVMRARNNVYHLECFACQQCNHRILITRTGWSQQLGSSSGRLLCPSGEGTVEEK